MTIPYRTKRRLLRLALALLAILVLVGVCLICWLLWANRYVIYTRDEGARLDFSLPPIAAGETADPDPDVDDISIYYNEGDDAINTGTELTLLSGYYVDPELLKKDMGSVRAQIQALPEQTPVMIDVKNIYGNFYYSSSVSTARSSEVDVEQMDSLIQYLNSGNRYTIARLPAFRDKNRGLSHDEDGVLHSSRGYLWMDEEGCYWLDPARPGALQYVVQITEELKKLGFDEVVYTDFVYPETEDIYVEGSMRQNLTSAANTLAATCATERFAVSFVNEVGFALPEGRTRLYLENIQAADLEKVVAESGLATPDISIVFLTELYDTRFEDYGTMRPLSGAH